jgi:predicted alpha-1,2-mannosidase
VRPAAVVLLFLGCGGGDELPSAPGSHLLVHWVDPFIGTGGEGNTFPGATVPWGLVSPSPHTRLSSVADYVNGQGLTSAGYRAGDPTLLGFGMTHISGAGCPDLGAPVLSAQAGDPVRGATTTYANERAWPGYYAVDLPDVVVETTATPRVALFRFRFSGDGSLVLDAARSLSWTSPPSGQVQIVSPIEVEGYSDTGSFCLGPNRGRVYFVLRIDRAADQTGVFGSDGDVAAWLRVGGGTLEARVGISLVSIDGARRNLDEPGIKAFDEVRFAAQAIWEERLGGVVVQGGSDEQRRTFYTALYHALLHPSVASDLDGAYLRFGGGTGTASAPRYHIFSLWDTYRTVHPLLALLYPQQAREMAQSLVDMTREAGAPPRWELAGAESDVMVGDPADIVLADSAVKGIVPDGLREVAPVLVAAASSGTHRPAAAQYDLLGYVPMDVAETVWGPVSTTLEYALADSALSRLLETLGLSDPSLEARSLGFLALWDGTFLRPRFADGSFFSPFDPDALDGSRFYQRSGGPGYVEGTAWTYLFAAPRSLPALVDKMGGEGAFLPRLQAFFDQGKLLGWNEPDLAYPYLFSHFAGQLPRTGPPVRSLLSRFTTARDGLPGNDDAGTLSAFYVFSAIGLYPDVPATADYAIGSPIFDRSELSIPGGTFVIESPHPTPSHIYPVNTPQRLPHSEIVPGETLTITLSDSL